MAPHDVRSSRGLLRPQLEALVPGGLGAGAHGGHADIQQIRLAGGDGVDAASQRGLEGLGLADLGTLDPWP